MLLGWFLIAAVSSSDLGWTHRHSLNGVLLYMRGVTTAKKRNAALAAAVSGELTIPAPQNDFASLMARLSGGAVIERRIEKDENFLQRLFKKEAPVEKKRKLRVLALDGGGMKGRNLLLVIRELERRCGKPVSEMFDLVCGTSIGGCGALFISHFGPAASDRADDALRELQTRCFANSSAGRFVREGKRCADERASLVTELLGGQDKDLRSAGPCAFVVASRPSQETGDPEPYLFRTYDHTEKKRRFPPLQGTSSGGVVAAIRATTAAPTYFTPFFSTSTGPLHDGGCGFNNPSLLALHEIAAAFPDSQVDLLVSVGCGHLGHHDESRSNTEEALTHRFARSILRSTNPRALYDRLNPPLPHKITPGEHREPVLQHMERSTASWLQDPAVSKRLDDIASRLLR